jgi:hypothetical protein
MKVGIEENVGFSAQINDKNTLVITATRVNPDADIFAGLNDAKVESTETDSASILIFPLQTKGFVDKVLVDVRPVKYIIDDIKELKSTLTYILSQYMPINEIEWDLYANSDITTDNQAQVLTTDDGLRIIYDNLARQFVAQLEEHGDPNKGFRVLFVRSSKKSPYPNIRRRFVSTNPFIESMDVPVEQTKLAFNKGEIKAELHHDRPLADDQSAADKDTSSLGSLNL